MDILSQSTLKLLFIDQNNPKESVTYEVPTIEKDSMKMRNRELSKNLDSYLVVEDIQHMSMSSITGTFNHVISLAKLRDKKMTSLFLLKI